MEIFSDHFKNVPFFPILEICREISQRVCYDSRVLHFVKPKKENGRVELAPSREAFKGFGGGMVEITFFIR